MFSPLEAPPLSPWPQSNVPLLFCRRFLTKPSYIHFYVTWKTEDFFDLAYEYDFIGIHFDHGEGTVAPCKKLVDKLNTFSFDEVVTAGELERLVGRLIHASAISGTYMGDFWFPLKYTRRIVNSLNRGQRRTTSPISVPQSVRDGLTKWIQTVQTDRHMSRVVGPARFTAFVDASTHRTNPQSGTCSLMARLARQTPLRATAWTVVLSTITRIRPPAAALVMPQP